MARLGIRSIVALWTKQSNCANQLCGAEVFEQITVSQIVKELPPVLCNPYFHPCFRSTPPFSLSRARIMQSKSPSYFFKTNFNIIFPSELISSKWSLSFSFAHQNPVCISRFLLSVPHTLPIPLCLITRTFGEQYRSRISLYAAPSSLLFLRPSYD